MVRASTPPPPQSQSSTTNQDQQQQNPQNPHNQQDKQLENNGNDVVVGKVVPTSASLRRVRARAARAVGVAGFFLSRFFFGFFFGLEI